MSIERFDESPLGQLERALIDEFVRARGFDPLTLINLADAERYELLKDASVYASSRLTEVESRAHFIHQMHET